MSGTVQGGRKAAKRNIELHGKDFYRIIGSKGGQNGHTGGFASMDREKVSAAGTKGGRISRRTGKSTGDKKEKEYVFNGDLNEKLVFKKAK